MTERLETRIHLAAQTVFVDAAATAGANTGASWANAYTSLQQGLAAASGIEATAPGTAVSVDVAQGTYYPTAGTDRTATFRLQSHVGIYGGFAGTVGPTAARSVSGYPTILSGDLGVAGVKTDNSGHVVTGSGTDATATLDGVTVTAGFANGTGADAVGAGLTLAAASPTVNGCTFVADGSVGGAAAVMVAMASAPTLANCQFLGDTGGFGSGGAVAVVGSTATIANCAFVGDTALGNGGGVSVGSGSTATIADSTFTADTASSGGAAVYASGSSTATVVNSVLYGNAGGTSNAGTGSPVASDGTGTLAVTYSDVQGGVPGTGNLNANPYFVRAPSAGADGVWGTADDDYGNLVLNNDSPAIDAGNNAAVPAAARAADLAGGGRFVDTPEVADTGVGTAPVVDLGAYESVPAVRALAGFSAVNFGPSDDGSTGAVPLGFAAPISFFGHSYAGLYVNNNGNVTFDGPQSTYSPFPLTSTSVRILAPFFADVDTSGTGSGTAHYGTGTVNGRPAFGVEWPAVGYFSGHTDRLDTFELVVIDRSDTGAGNFDFEFNYDQVRWQAGDASGGAGGLGGTPARAGYSASATGPSAELPGSGVNGAFLDSNTATGLIYNSQGSAVPGRYVFNVRNGAVVFPDLTVTNLAVVPAAPRSGQAVAVNWTDANAGNGPTTGSFYDHVTVTNTTTGQTLASQDVYYDAAANGNIPAANGTAARTLGLTLPAGNAGVGALAVSVTADSRNTVTEYNTAGTGETNNTAATTATSTLAPYPDLQVTGLTTTTPATGLVSGGTLTVNWTEANTGTAAAPGSVVDRLTVVNQTTGQTLVSTDLTGAAAPIAAGGAAARTATVVLPNGPAGAGTLLVTVTADGPNAVAEYNAAGTGESNNAASTTATSVLAPYPDLVVRNLTTTPATGVQSGAALAVTWSDANTGVGPVSGSFVDQVQLLNATTGAVLSTQAVAYDATAAGPIAAGPIAAGSSAARSATVKLPDGSAGVGSFTVKVTANATGTVFESNPAGTATANNAATVAVTSTLAPYPDLQVSAVAGPARGYNGQAVVVGWTDANAGTAAANGPWTDVVYAATDAQGHNPVQLGSFDFTGSIAAGASVQRVQQVNLPSTPGTYYLLVKTNTTGSVQEGDAAGNDAGVAAAATVVAQVPLPDLVVAGITPPPNGVLSGTAVPVTYVVKNQGTAATSVPVWQDFVVLSQDPTLAATYGPGLVGVGSDQTLNNQPVIVGFDNPSYLDVGQSYAQTVNVTLPVTAQGTWYVYVVPDGTGGHHPPSMPELSRTDKIAISPAFTITLSPFPDLAVTAVAAPSQNFSGQPTTVAYTVANRGPAQAAAGGWADAVYYSTKSTFDATAVLLGSMTHAGPLAAGATYSGSATVTLPVGVSGPYYFFVKADAGGAVFENGQTANNVAGTLTAVTVNLTPPPDLTVTAVTPPAAAAVAGHALAFTYTTTNAGAGPTPNSSWTDSYYLSPTAGYNPATAIALGSQTHVGALAAGAAYTASVTATVPNGTAGSYYVVVVTDSAAAVFELNRANNAGGSRGTVAVTSVPADLVVNALTGPATAVPGTGVSLAYTVANQGLGDTAGATWADAVYVSGKATFDATATRLATFAGNGPLAAGGAYTRTVSVTLPINLLGAYNLFVVTNAAGGSFEADTANDASPALPITLALQTVTGGAGGGGTGTTTTAQVSDLVPVSVTAPAAAATGSSVTVAWTVTNAGAGATNANYWYDDLWLSTRATLGSGGTDVFLGTVQHTNPVAAGTTYAATGTFAVPRSLAAGRYYAIVAVDRPTPPTVGATGGNLVYESDETNNTRAAPATTAVTVTPPADLAVTAVTAPATATAGSSIAVGWTVRNLGADTGNVPVGDAVYLSLDQTLDPSDKYLATVTHTGGLAAGGSYAASATLALPAGVAGTYYVFVQTNAGQTVYETVTANDAAAAPAPTAVALPLPANLVAGTVTIPAAALAGQNLTVNYQVTNAGANPANGSWVDSLYLSPTPAFAAADPLLGRVTQSRTLAPGATYAGTLTAPVPGVAPGTYYVIVRTNILNTLPETTQADNLSASLTGTSIDAPTLTLGVPATGTLATGQSAYYKVVVPANQTLRFTLTGAAAAANELYVSYATLPTRAAYDFRYTTPLQPGQQITVPTTRAGTYYVLAYAAAAGGAAEPYTLTAAAIPFSVAAVAPAAVDNAGSSTIQVTGARFDRGTTFQLVSSKGSALSASAVYFQDSGTVYATFPLTGANPGTYTLRATAGDGTTLAVATAPVTVSAPVPAPTINPAVAGLDGLLETYFVAPTAILPGRVGDIQVVYTNLGNHDIPAPLLTVQSPVGTAIGRSAADLASGVYLSFLGTSPTGPAGVLRPGQSASQTIYFRSSTTVGVINETDLQVNETDDTSPIDLQPYLPAALLSAPNFAAVLANLRQTVGATWGGYVRALAQDATLLPPSAGDNTNPTTLLSLSATRATAAVGTSISGTVAAVDPAVPLGGNTVTALNLTTRDSYSATVLTDGSFVFPTVTAGTYRLAVPDARVNAPAPVVVAAGRAVTGVTLAASPGAAIAGTVTAFGTGRPVAGVTVTAYDAAGVGYAAAASDAAGQYQILGLAPGTYSVLAGGPAGIGFALDGVAVAASGTTAVGVAYGATGTVTGTLSLAAGLPAGSAVTVTAVARSGAARNYVGTVTGNAFAVPNLLAGTYAVRVEAPGYAPVTLPAVAVAAGQTTSVGVVAPGPGATVSAAVALNGSAATGTLVVVASLDGGTDLDTFTATVTAGRFSLGGLPAGTYTVDVAGPLTDGVEATVTVAAGGSVDLGTLALPAAAGAATPADPHAPAAGPLPTPTAFALAQMKAYLLATLIPAEFALFGPSVAGLWYDFIESTPSSPTPEQYFTDGSGVVEGILGYRRDGQIQGNLQSLLDTAADRIRDRYNAGALSCTDGADGTETFSLTDLIPEQNLIHPPINFSNPFTIPGNTAGGEGSWAPASRQDDRFFGGTVTATVSSGQLTVESQITATVVDSIDFDPGDLGAPLERFLFTEDLKALETSGDAFGVPFTVSLTDDPGRTVTRSLMMPDCPPPPAPPPQTPPPTPTPPAKPPTRAPDDPNDILGPVGFGPAKYVPVAQQLGYTVEFENKPTATAPAQGVTITDPLDPNLDARTFRLGSFGWGGHIYTVPANSAFYQTRIDPTGTGAYFVDVTATIDVSTDVATWTFATVDPATGEVPLDPTVGFLPPDDAAGDGSGFVRYTVLAGAGDATGTTINAKATVVFSNNPPIDTPTIFNTVDAGSGLTSTVAPLPAVEPTPTFGVAWSGSDAGNGSAVAAFTVYVSVDGGPFAAWLTNTTLTAAQYAGALGHAYGFYTVAFDNAGNVQATPAAAQATTVVLGTPVVTLGRPPAGLTYDGTAGVLAWATAAVTGLAGQAAPTGAATVVYYNGTGAAGTPLAAPPVNPGTYTAVAVYAGDANYAAGTSGPVTFTVAAAAVTVTLPAVPPSIVYDGTTSVTSWVRATVTGPAAAPAPTGGVTYVYYAGTSATGTPLASSPVAAGTYTVVAVYSGNSNYAGAASAPATFTVTQPVAPLSVFFKVDDGSAQRSMVRSLTVTFGSAVTLQSGAITLLDGTGNAVTAGVTLASPDGGTTWVLSFAGDAFTGGSLANGRYTLRVDHAKVVANATGATLAADQTLGFFRLFGDFYGTGTVNAQDRVLFASVSRGLNAAYAPYADYNGSGSIDAADTAAFNADYGRSI